MPTSVKKPLPPPASVHYNHSVVPPAPPPVLTAPPVGQTVLVPVAAPDGSLVQVQLCTLPTPPTLSSVSGVSSLSTPSRYKYINPHLVPSLSNLNTSQPPPGYTPHTPAPSDQTTNSSTWTNQVDDFLSRPKSHKNSGDSHKSPSRSCSPKKVKTGSKRKVTLVHTSNKACFKDASPIKIRKIDRAKILARMKARDEEVDSPDGKAEVNELDISPEDKLYKGEIMDWRGKFGFIGCEEINGKIFVHSKDFVEGRELADLGVEAVFQVLHQDSSVVGAKAVNVKITKT
eukprot:GFUD01065772.1.p1 GENE.GFUD01065772.1~~GFUD01065772.1.p1  ORF type:complete len:287 (-),score=91.06 GFUD01065772.1:404-1264(-)